MESKKHPKADLNKKAGLFFNIGLALSILIVTAAFEWKNYDEGDMLDLGTLDMEMDEILEIPPTEQPPPPPPKVVQPEIVEVPDEEEIEQEIEIELDIEFTEEKVIEQQVFEVEEEEEEIDEIFDSFALEVQPEPEGGLSAFYDYVSKNMKYPASARRMGIEGKVFLVFIIDTDGSISNVEVLKGISADCDAEAVRVVSGAPKWKPGKQRGRAVKVRMRLPITFQLG
ncbi:energy transducer TonB [Peijinzhouia sedimentorum]